MNKSKKYTHIFFDLDETLWDYHTNANEVLDDLFTKYSLPEKNITKEAFIREFHHVNTYLWDLYNQSLIEKEAIRDQRFARIFERLGLSSDHVPDGLDRDYLMSCPAKGHLMPFAKEALEHLKDKYKLHILTNGFNDVQGIKMKSSGIAHYFEHVITSDMANAKKPDIKIYDYALKAINSTSDKVIMIGDRMETDILGAMSSGIDQIYYNPKSIEHNEEVTYEIRCLSEISELL